MRFKDHFYNEAEILHIRPRTVMAQPKMVDMLSELEGKRLFTMINNDNMYFTYVMDNHKDIPLGVYIGDYANIFDKPQPSATTEQLAGTFKRLYAPKKLVETTH